MSVRRTASSTTEVLLSVAYEAVRLTDIKRASKKNEWASVPGPPFLSLRPWASVPGPPFLVLRSYGHIGGKRDAQLHSRLTKCLQLGVGAQIIIKEMQQHQQQQRHKLQLQRAAVAAAIGALCISYRIAYTGPRPVQTLSDFEECLRKYNWLNNQPDSSPVPEDAWEGLQQTRGTVSN
jgi:hypothetical protein